MLLINYPEHFNLISFKKYFVIIANLYICIVLTNIYVKHGHCGPTHFNCPFTNTLMIQSTQFICIVFYLWSKTYCRKLVSK